MSGVDTTLGKGMSSSASAGSTHEVHAGHVQSVELATEDLDEQERLSAQT
jgi:hypothetical protein